jgi:hypothetical protein
MGSSTSRVWWFTHSMVAEPLFGKPNLHQHKPEPSQRLRINPAIPNMEHYDH